MNIKKISAALIAAAMLAAAAPVAAFAEENGGLVESDGGLAEDNGGLIEDEGKDPDEPAEDQNPQPEIWTDSLGNKWNGKFHIIDIDSQYSITVDKVVVNGVEKAAVKISGLSSRMLDTNYERDDYRIDWSDGDYLINRRDLEWLNVTIDIGERYFCFAANDVEKGFKGAVVTAVPYSNSKEFIESYRGAYFNIAGNILFDPDELPDEYPEAPDNYKQTLIEKNQDRLDRANVRFFDTEVKRNGDTFDLTGYFDVDDEVVKELVSAKETTVATCAYVIMHGGAYEADGNPLPAGGASLFYLEFTSDNKMIAVYLYDDWDSEYSLVYGIDVDEGLDEKFGEFDDDVHKEIVKITNNLNTATESPSIPDGTITPSTPTTITPSTSEPATSSPDTSAPAVTKNEFKPVLTSTGLDEETERVLGGISVTDTNSAFEVGVVMNVKSGQTTLGFSFDITFTKDGNEVQPNGNVTVKIPVPEALKGKTVYVFHVEDGKFVLVNSEVKDGFVVFSANHFSEYVLSTENLNADSTSAASSVPTAPDNGNPNTGVVLAAGPVLFAASAAVIIVSKKKK